MGLPVSRFAAVVLNIAIASQISPSGSLGRIVPVEQARLKNMFVVVFPPVGLH